MALHLAQGTANAALVAHWQFDETTGLVADEAVADNDGTLVGFPGDDSQWQPGVIGNALRFDGTNDHVVHGFNLPRTQGTIAHWLNAAVAGPNMITVYESNSPGGGALYDGLGDPASLLEIHSGTTSNWQARYQDGDGAGGNNAAGFGRFNTSSEDQPPVIANVWTHVAMTWNTSGDLVLYVNCQEVGRVALAPGTFAGLATTERFIGRPSEPTRFWNGLIDDVQIYDNVLSRDDIERIAQFCPAPGAATAVPTLREWGVVVLAALLAWLAMAGLRRRVR